jgi:hypothetical protein
VSEHPEEFIENSEPGFGVPAFHDSQLLSERQILQEQAPLAAKAARK